MENRILLTNIQRFSLHDGPGIRTTVFLKGCSLRCPWCSNPENLSNQPQPYIKDGIKGIYGKWYTPEELVQECLLDRVFYNGKTENWDITSEEEIDLLPGGVTFSGGEALLQIKQLIPVITALHDQGIHIAAETCLFVPTSNLLLAIRHIDFFYADVKIMNREKARDIEQGDLTLYLNNFDIIMKSGKPVVIRIPVVGQKTDTVENRKAVYELLQQYRDKILKIELIKEHNLGESKYKSLNIDMYYYGVSDQLMEEYRTELLNLGIPVEVCKA